VVDPPLRNVRFLESKAIAVGGGRVDMLVGRSQMRPGDVLWLVGVGSHGAIETKELSRSVVGTGGFGLSIGSGGDGVFVAYRTEPSRGEFRFVAGQAGRETSVDNALGVARRSDMRLLSAIPPTQQRQGVLALIDPTALTLLPLGPSAGPPRKIDAFHPLERDCFGNQAGESSMTALSGTAFVARVQDGKLAGGWLTAPTTCTCVTEDTETGPMTSCTRSYDRADVRLQLGVFDSKMRWNHQQQLVLLGKLPSPHVLVQPAGGNLEVAVESGHRKLGESGGVLHLVTFTPR